MKLDRGKYDNHVAFGGDILLNLIEIHADLD